MKENLDPSIPFAKARELSVNLPLEEKGKAKVFVDDIISVCDDKGENLKCIKAAPCTVIHAVANRFVSKTEVKRDDLICDKKKKARRCSYRKKFALSSG